jgi:TPR repeat protein
MYAEGRGVAKNEAEAAKWCLKLAEQGNTNAQYILGKMYAEGKGVAQNNAEAVKWYRKAAERGDAPLFVANTHRRSCKVVIDFNRVPA